MNSRNGSEANKGYKRSRSKRYGRWLLRPWPFVAMLLLIAAVRFLLVAHIVLPGGQHALVSLTYCGLRLPGEQYWGYKRLGYAYPAAGDAIVFQQTDKAGVQTQQVGIVRALPGGCIWTDRKEKLVLTERSSRRNCRIPIPARGQTVSATPENAGFLAYILHEFENRPKVKTDERGLFQGLKRLDKVAFTDDYYWVEVEPGKHIVVPHRNLVGRIFYIWNVGSAKR